MCDNIYWKTLALNTQIRIQHIVCIVLFSVCLFGVPETANAAGFDSIKKVIDVVIKAFTGSIGQAMATLAMLFFFVLAVFGVISMKWGAGLIIGIGGIWGVVAIVSSMWG